MGEFRLAFGRCSTDAISAGKSEEFDYSVDQINSIFEDLELNLPESLEELPEISQDEQTFKVKKFYLAALRKSN